MKKLRLARLLAAWLVCAACTTTGPVYHNARTADSATVNCRHATKLGAPNETRAAFVSVDNARVPHRFSAWSPRELNLSPGAHTIVLSLEAGGGLSGAGSVTFVAEAGHAYHVVPGKADLQFEISLWDETNAPGKLLGRWCETGHLKTVRAKPSSTAGSCAVPGVLNPFPYQQDGPPRYPLPTQTAVPAPNPGP